MSAPPLSIQVIVGTIAVTVAVITDFAHLANPFITVLLLVNMFYANLYLFHDDRSRLHWRPIVGAAGIAAVALMAAFWYAQHSGQSYR